MKNQYFDNFFHVFENDLHDYMPYNILCMKKLLYYEFLCVFYQYRHMRKYFITK